MSHPSTIATLVQAAVFSTLEAAHSAEVHGRDAERRLDQAQEILARAGAEPVPLPEG